MDKIKLKNIVEAILLSSDRILNLGQIEKMLTEKPDSNKKAEDTEIKEPVSQAANDEQAETTTADKVETEQENNSAEEEPAEESAESVSLKRAISDVIEMLQQDYSGRSMELKEVASGYRFQVRQEYAEHVGKLWEEKPSKYSRALLETLVLIAYRQPITRGEIEAIRGVSVSSHIIKTLIEREWVRVIGHRDVPGKPAIFGSTKEFLDYFNLKSLDELPSLAEIKDLDKIAPELALNEDEESTEGEKGEEVVDRQQGSAKATDNREKIQIRQMRRVRRMRRLSGETAESDESTESAATTGQETEPEEA